MHLYVQYCAILNVDIDYVHVINFSQCIRSPIAHQLLTFFSFDKKLPSAISCWTWSNMLNTFRAKGLSGCKPPPSSEVWQLKHVETMTEVCASRRVVARPTLQLKAFEVEDIQTCYSGYANSLVQHMFESVFMNVMLHNSPPHVSQRQTKLKGKFQDRHLSKVRLQLHFQLLQKGPLETRMQQVT